MLEDNPYWPFLVVYVPNPVDCYADMDAEIVFYFWKKKKKHEKDDHLKNNSFLKLKKKWKNEFTQAEFYQP